MPSIELSTAKQEISASAKPLSSFTHLSKVVRLYEPSTPSTKGSGTEPTTILFCAWMNASSKHIQYYTNWYTSRFPNARIVLVTITTAQFILESEAKRRADIKAAVTAILAGPQESERLLIHSLSNGGGKRLYGIAASYRAITGKPLPALAIIMDSAPGIPQFRRNIHGMLFPASKFSWLFWIPYMAVVVAIAIVIFVVMNWLPGWVWWELVWGPTEGLSNPEYLDMKAVKGFVYSKEDMAIDWRDVERYAEGAEKKGYRVLRKRIEGAPHVQMFKGKGGEKEYWGFIEKTWVMGVSRDFVVWK